MALTAGDNSPDRRPQERCSHQRAFLSKEPALSALVSDRGTPWFNISIATTRLSTDETSIRREIARIGLSLFERGLTPGSTGNISARMGDGSFLVTPTNASLGALDPTALALVEAEGRHVDGDRPSKESFLHSCMYAERPEAHAVIHLHSTQAVAVSILADVNGANVLPALTAYYVMRVGRLPLIPYFPPGDKKLALAVKAQAAAHHAILLANHGPVVAGKTLQDAQYAIEELEETARLYLLLRGERLRPLTNEQVEALRMNSQSR
jgi:ribulose-5-phosphate 4-epimerase/fuculose-1-phosphate aldolase